MEESYLIQRLNRPWGNALGGRLGPDNPFAFGGGLRNGGLSEEGMSLLREIFSFDYMGSAEFEWGAVPDALSAIAKRAKHYRAGSTTIPLADVAIDFRDDRGALEGERTVWVIAHREHLDEAIRRIHGWAREGFNRGLKETTRLSSSLRPFHEWDEEVQGWLELDNGFFFFADEEMWRNVASLFGVKVEEEVSG